MSTPTVSIKATLQRLKAINQAEPLYPFFDLYVQWLMATKALNEFEETSRCDSKRNQMWLTHDCCIAHRTFKQNLQMLQARANTLNKSPLSKNTEGFIFSPAWWRDYGIDHPHNMVVVD